MCCTRRATRRELRTALDTIAGVHDVDARVLCVRDVLGGDVLLRGGARHTGSTLPRLTMRRAEC